MRIDDWRRANGRPFSETSLVVQDLVLVSQVPVIPPRRLASRQEESHRGVLSYDARHRQGPSVRTFSETTNPFPLPSLDLAPWISRSVYQYSPHQD